MACSIHKGDYNLSNNVPYLEKVFDNFLHCLMLYKSAISFYKETKVWTKNKDSSIILDHTKYFGVYRTCHSKNEGSLEITSTALFSLNIGLKRSIILYNSKGNESQNSDFLIHISLLPNYEDLKFLNYTLCKKSR